MYCFLWNVYKIFFWYFSVVSGSSDKKLYLGEIEWEYMTTRISLSDSDLTKCKYQLVGWRQLTFLEKSSFEDSIMNTWFCTLPDNVFDIEVVLY